MYIFGGVNRDDDCNRTSELYQLWLAVPPLQELCWRSVLDLVDKKENNVEEKLKILQDLGVPRTLLTRLGSLPAG